MWVELQPHPDQDDTTTLYRIFDAEDRLLYVGITGQGFNRFRGHAKDKHWWWCAHRIQMVHFSRRDDALRAEQLAIEAEKPMFNIQGAEGRRDWIDALQDAHAQGYFDAVDVLRKRLAALSDNLTWYELIAKEMTRELEDGQLMMRRLRTESRNARPQLGPLGRLDEL